MSQISYNGINLGLVRTEYMQADPVFDETGMDLLCTHVTIEAQSVMHPNVTASDIIQNAGPGGIPQGDTAALSLVNLRQALLQPRKPLIYTIGPKNVIVSPAVDQIGGLGVFRNRDCQDGPHAIDCRVTQIEGDFRFLIYFKVETWITGFSNALLSNRWSVISDTDLTGLTTRIIQGRAVIRGDAVRGAGGNAVLQSPDDFRQSIFLPIPVNFIREKIRCTVTPDQRTLNYFIIDRETGLALGGKSVAVEMKGNATAGSEGTINSIRTAIGKAEKMAKEVAGLDVMGFVKDSLDSLVPINKANCLIRVNGQPGATRVALAGLAANVCQDRMRAALIVSAYCTQGLDSDKTPWCEVRVEYFPTVASIVGGIMNPLNFSLQMNMSDTINGPNNVITPPIAFNDATGRNPAPPSDGGTRGSYIGALAVQTFAGDGAVPVAPPADASRQQFGVF